MRVYADTLTIEHKLLVDSLNFEFEIILYRFASLHTKSLQYAHDYFNHISLRNIFIPHFIRMCVILLIMRFIGYDKWIFYFIFQETNSIHDNQPCKLHSQVHMYRWE